MNRKFITAVAVAVATAVAAPAVASADVVHPPAAHTASYNGDMREARAIVNEMDSDLVDTFCEMIDTADEVGMSRESMYRSFRHGYGHGQHPSARQVFNVLLSRC